MDTKQTAVDYLYSRWLEEGIITIKDYQMAKVMEKEQDIILEDLLNEEEE